MVTPKKPPEQLDKRRATLAQAAAHVAMGERRFRDYVAMGVITKPQKGHGYDLDVVRREYIEHIRAIAAGRTTGGMLDPHQERARKDSELADNVELKTKQLREMLVPAKDVEATLEDIFSRVRLKIGALPAAVAPYLIGLEESTVAQATLSKAVRDLLDDLANVSISGLPEQEPETEAES